MKLNTLMTILYRHQNQWFIHLTDSANIPELVTLLKATTGLQFDFSSLEQVVIEHQLTYESTFDPIPYLFDNSSLFRKLAKQRIEQNAQSN